MTDGVSAALQHQQDCQNHHAVSIKTWSRTLPDGHIDQHAILKQYSRYVDHLENGQGVIKHVFTPLKVTRATTTTDFRWLSQASKISNSEIAKYTLSHRSDFIRKNEDLEDVYELDLLEDFHSASISTRLDSTPGSSNAAAQGRKKPLHVYDRKSTRGPGHWSPSILPSLGPLRAFRKLLETASSQDTNDDSILSTTPRTADKKRRLASDSPATSSAPEREPDASTSSSLSPSPTPPKVQSRRPAGFQQVSLPKKVAEPKGRQPLRLQANTSAIPLDRDIDGRSTSMPVKAKAKPALRPITRKLPLKKAPAGLEEKSTAVHKSSGNVISHARRLQTLGGSWPLKRQRADTGDIPLEDDEGLEEETTEIIEDYTLQVDITDISETGLKFQNGNLLGNMEQVENTRTEATVHLATNAVVDSPVDQGRSANDYGHASARMSNVVAEATAFDLPNLPAAAGEHVAFYADRHDGSEVQGFFDNQVFRSTNLPLPPSPPSLSGNPTSYTSQTSEAVAPRGDIDSPEPMLAVFNQIPNISVTLATSPLRTQSQQARPSPQEKDKTFPKTSQARKAGEMHISLATFLSLAFGEESLHSRITLQTRCIPKFKTLSRPIIPSTVLTCFVPSERLLEGGMFHRGYLGPGRRGFWEIPLRGRGVSGQPVSGGAVLGLREELSNVESSPTPTILWTLPRLRYFLAHIQKIASSGRFGVVTVCTTALASSSDEISLEVSCQSSMALMLRTIISETALSLDEHGNEAEPDTGKIRNSEPGSQRSEQWLDSKAGVRLVWWDEAARIPILAA